MYYSVLYANKALLKRYNKEVPKTWDELIETTKFILDKEKDTNLIGYKGYFPGI